MVGYYAECDCCGTELEFEGSHILYDTKKELRKICRENGWKVIGGKCVCSKCSEKQKSKKT